MGLLFKRLIIVEAAEPVQHLAYGVFLHLLPHTGIFQTKQGNIFRQHFRVSLQLTENGVHPRTKSKHRLQTASLKHFDRGMPDQRVVGMFIIALFPFANACARQCRRERLNPVSRIKSGVIEDNIHSHCLLVRCFIFIFNWLVSITNLSLNRVADKRGAFRTFRNQVA